MPKFLQEPNTRRFTNTTGAKLNCGDLVKLPDNMAGIVQGLAGVANNASGNAQTTGIITITKAAPAVAIVAGDRIQIHQTTMLASAKVGAADASNFICGRATLASGVGVVEVTVELNSQGPTI